MGKQEKICCSIYLIDEMGHYLLCLRYGPKKGSMGTYKKTQPSISKHELRPFSQRDAYYRLKMHYNICIAQMLSLAICNSIS